MNERIRALRKHLGLTQKEFGERIGLKQNTVALIESGKRNTSEQTVLAICYAFQTNEKWLRTGAGSMLRTEPDDELDALIKKYHLSPESKIIIEKFISLKPADRDMVAAYITQVADAIRDSAQ